MSAEPSHGSWCNSRTYPTRCQYCREDVFYFSCNHGSKIFFDSLGQPWPEHRCVQYLIARFGRETFDHGLAERMMTPVHGKSLSIAEDYALRVEERFNRKVPPEIVRADPYSGATTIEEGVVREIWPLVDVYKRFDIRHDAPVGVAALGPLARGDYGQITVHTEPIEAEDQWSYTLFVARKQLEILEIQKGDFVRCHLTGFKIIGKGIVWMCESIARAF